MYTSAGDVEVLPGEILIFDVDLGYKALDDG